MEEKNQLELDIINLNTTAQQQALEASLREAELKKNNYELEDAREGLQADLNNQVQTSVSLQEALDQKNKHYDNL